MQFHSLKLISKKQQTADAFTFTFEVPEELRHNFKFKHGQYITVKFEINGSDERRSYSLCSSPFENEWTVAVKKVEGGKVSTHMIEQLKEGTIVEIAPPEGKFTTKIDAEQSKSYYLFGAGSGITPLMSILKTILEEEPKSTVFLLYGNRNEDSIIFKNELASLESRYSGQLIVEYTLSQPRKEKGSWFKKDRINWSGKVGRIDKTMVEAYLQEYPSRSNQEAYFICGPTEMIQTVEKTLEAKGIDKKSIHLEYFTAPATEGGETAQSATSAKATVHLDGSEIEIEIPKGQNILDALMDEGYDPPYSCKSGACSTCIAKVLKGKAEMESCLALDDDEVQEGYILSCQAHPTTAEVEITFEV